MSIYSFISSIYHVRINFTLIFTANSMSFSYF